MKIDPVCGATFAVVVEARAVRRYRNRYYYFCSLKCREAFDLAPHRFIPTPQTKAPGKIHRRRVA